MDKLEEPVDLNEMIHILFDDYDSNSPNDIEPVRYPELILQESNKGNKLYSCFQSYNRQFINDSNATTSTKQGDIVRWNGSSMEMSMGIILDNWLNQSSTGQQGSKSSSTKLKKSISRANALFTWASTDEYIEERKKELRRLRKINNLEDKEDKPVEPEEEEEVKVMSEEDIRKQELTDNLHITFPKSSINNKLNRLIEIESNKFVHLRIQRIKAHYSEQMAKQINERKRKDQELHLKKLKLKEEEYERDMMLQNQMKSSSAGGFLGTLFGFGSSTQSGASNASVENFNNRSSNESNRTIDSATFSTISSSKNKRFPLFAVQSLFGGSSKKNSSKVVLFDQDDSAKGTESDDNHSLRGSLIQEANENTGEIPNEETTCNNNTPKVSIDDQQTTSPLPDKSIETPRESIQQETFFSIDQLEKHMSKSPEEAPHNNIQNGLPHHMPLQIASTDNNDDEGGGDDDDDEFDDFTSAQPIHEPEITIFQDPPKLSRNFFSIDKAHGSSETNQNHNDLLDVFSNNDTSSKPTSPVSNEANLLDL